MESQQRNTLMQISETYDWANSIIDNAFTEKYVESHGVKTVHLIDFSYTYD